MEKEIIDIEKAASHYLLAAIGKKVLRPGGRELTTHLIKQLNIKTQDSIIEFAPGQGFTTHLVLEKSPASYIGIDIDTDHVRNLKKHLSTKLGADLQVIAGDAEDTALPSASCDKIIGEAILSMHADVRKKRIIKEANRLLKLNGKYAIHELELNLHEEKAEKHRQIQHDLALASHVNARPLTIDEWTTLLEDAGFKIESIERRPLKVLDPSRIIADEGILQTLRISINLIKMPRARKRVFNMRKTFKAHDKHLNAVAIIARKVKNN